MGSGKTTWAMQELVDKSPNNIMFITPFLTECDRIQQCAKRRFEQPRQIGNGKLDNLRNLLQDQVDIVSTHSLFQKLDARCKEAIKKGDYILILDETLDAVAPYKFTNKDDFVNLLEKKDITVDADGMIQWTGQNYDTRYNDVKVLAQNHSLFRVDQKCFLWLYPAEIFSLFKEVYILTYMFEGSYMKPYFDFYHINYDMKSVKQIDSKPMLVDYIISKPSRFKDRIQVYDGILNDKIGTKTNSLSATWFRSPYHKKELEGLKKNIYNYTRNIVKAKSAEILWTTFKSARHSLRGKGYSDGFIPCNTRATNDYSDRTALIYALNWFCNPEIIKFFADKGICVNQEAVALSNMVQWIWRSAIRNGEPISIYIPSKRMRELFKKWLNDGATQAYAHV